MPPRLLVVGIVLFWLATTSWLCYREVWPRLRAGDAPPFSIDLTDEVGANVIPWRVMQKDEVIGGGISLVKRLPDRTFKLHTEIKFQKLRVLTINIKKIEWTYIVTPDGKLVSASGKTRIRSANNNDPKEFPDEEIGFQGDVRDGQLEPTVTWNGQVVAKLDPLPLSPRASLVNPAAMINKIDGLRVGQEWKVPMLLDSLPIGLPNGLTVPEVFAVVSEGLLRWPLPDKDKRSEEDEDDNNLVPCFRIDYSKSADEQVATTWVRRCDNVVLKQEVRMHGMDLSFVRAMSD